MYERSSLDDCILNYQDKVFVKTIFGKSTDKVSRSVNQFHMLMTEKLLDLFLRGFS